MKKALFLILLSLSAAISFSGEEEDYEVEGLYRLSEDGTLFVLYNEEEFDEHIPEGSGSGDGSGESEEYRDYASGASGEAQMEDGSSVYDEEEEDRETMSTPSINPNVNPTTLSPIVPTTTFELITSEESTLEPITTENTTLESIPADETTFESAKEDLKLETIPTEETTFASTIEENTTLEPTSSSVDTAITHSNESTSMSGSKTNEPFQADIHKYVDLESGNCSSLPYGCCLNSTLPAHSITGMGCCISDGCCPDLETSITEECHCSSTRGGCCKDGISYAALGCGCIESEFGCCPDQYTRAKGHNFEGCSCHTFPYGCCLDGVTPDNGNGSCQSAPGNCRLAEFGCCPDGETEAEGVDFGGCGCEASEFGCCPDGKNEAKGEDFEGCASKPGGVCHMKKDPGNCRSYNITRQWYFDIQYGGCSLFWYSGCGGNGNKFEDRESCESTCVSPSGAVKCYLPKVPGPVSCTSNRARYYFDQESKECTDFTYNGCLGNANRFPSLGSCREECMKAVKRPRSEDPCEQPPEPGPCHGYFPLWHYDSSRGECTKFIFGGCKGNKNKFVKKEACENSCKHNLRTQSVKSKCRRPLTVSRDTRDCGEYPSVIPKWYFDEDIHSCIPFYLSSNQNLKCGSILIEENGNETLFDSLMECREACPNTYEPIISVTSHTIVVKEEEVAILRVQISANPPPSISWSFNGSNISLVGTPHDPRISIDPMGTLSIQAALATDSGKWIVKAENGIGDGALEEIMLTVNPSEAPIRVRIHQTGENPYQIGSTIKLACEVSGFPIPHVNWYKNNARLPNAGRVRWSKESMDLVIENANLIDNGYYTCRAWNFRESSHDSRNIQVEKSKDKVECVDKPWLARCELIVRGRFCLRDPSYFQICCQSCTLAGLIYNP